MINEKGPAGQRLLFLDNCPQLVATSEDLDVSWQNTGKSPIAAWQVVVLRLDPFGELLNPTSEYRYVSESGHTTKDWRPIETRPLPPGETVADEEGIRWSAFVCVGFVSRVRLLDGTVWDYDYPTMGRLLKELDPKLHAQVIDDNKTPPRASPQ